VLVNVWLAALVSVAIDPAPVPDTAKVLVLYEAALIEMLPPAYVVPMAVGVKVTATVQLPPGATLVHALVLNA
jgi:hypothetical protein